MLAAISVASAMLLSGSPAAVDPVTAAAAVCQKGDSSLLAAALNALLAADYELALKCWRESADQGDPAGQYILGSTYYDGNIVEKDDAEAFRWIKMAADQGHEDALYKLSEMYAKGEGVQRDPELAETWYLIAEKQHYEDIAKMWENQANEGNSYAQLITGKLYASGEGVSKSYSHAAWWYKQSAEQGDELGQFALGESYEKGEGVPQNFSEAAWWYQKAAEQGFDLAQYELGMSYSTGSGVPQNLIESYKWLALAAHEGGEEAVKARDDVMKRMTADQIAEGQRLALAWSPKR